MVGRCTINYGGHGETRAHGSSPTRLWMSTVTCHLKIKIGSAKNLSASLRGKTSMPTGNIVTVLESKIIHGKNTAECTETAH